MLYLHTGAPGAGKTLSAVEMIETVLQENPSRVIYSNINGINYPGVISVDFDWMAEWWDRATPGSLIVIDEAQQIWRSTRGGGDPGRAITDLETHRHDGIDIVMITQHPTLIHANIRKLVTRHVHLVEYTKTTALRWDWRECHDDVQEKELRATGDFKEWKYPARLYAYYVSATAHTKRTRTPRSKIKGRIWGAISILCMLVMIGTVAYYAPKLWRKAHGVVDSASTSTDGKPKADAPAAPGGGEGRKVVHLSTPEYVAQQVPRVVSQPWSAPIYDGQSVTQHPQVWCIAPELPEHCRCITEQGTRYEMPQLECRRYAETGGAYDPYRQERRRDDPARSPAAAPADPSAAPAVAAAALPVGIPGPRPGGVGAASYVPPAYGAWNSDPFGSNGKQK